MYIPIALTDSLSTSVMLLLAAAAATTEGIDLAALGIVLNRASPIGESFQARRRMPDDYVRAPCWPFVIQPVMFEPCDWTLGRKNGTGLNDIGG
jgi:hypothetical protein